MYHVFVIRSWRPSVRSISPGSATGEIMLYYVLLSSHTIIDKVEQHHAYFHFDQQV